ncbi:glutathione S-transferase [Novosphingobium chloroacetimidivorans]|uniref:Glutathione S-transferase n=1 Tax=Novosphingobium chloroacetimidivorans TaxID=1428314 RepID=A0A7W7KBM0_9SPHN|nr:glutathione S-transferase family protein [Novosphingobium chloroacetimidivorans]MBB4859829.1 glutathione S-transferase [Novosphingobium chloroacetimidivorans]
MLTIWGRLNSHNVKKVAWLAVELGLEFERIDTGGQFGMDAAYLAKNPNALIPTIEDGKVTLWESNAILRYLAAQYGGERWWPADAGARAMGDRWMDWQFGYADAQRDAFLHNVRKPAAERRPELIAASVAACTRHLAVIERYLTETPWLSGVEFGIGDIPMGVYANTWFALPIERPPFPAIQAWFQRICTRPGFAEQVAIPLS